MLSSFYFFLFLFLVDEEFHITRIFTNERDQSVFDDHTVILKDGMLANLSNPKTAIFYASVFSAAMPQNISYQTILAMINSYYYSSVLYLHILIFRIFDYYFHLFLLIADIHTILCIFY